MAPTPEVLGVAAKGWNSCAWTRDQVKCWGDVLGRVPVPTGFSNLRQVAVGENDACAVDDDEGLWCWGQSAASRPPGDMGRPSAVSLGYFSACAIVGERVDCWGEWGFDESVPAGLRAPWALAVAGTHICVIDLEGVKCWGDNGSGQLAVPAGLKNPRAISAGFSHTCVLDDEGVKCWGASEKEQTQVPAGLKNPREISAGRAHSCALDDEGIKCWGDIREYPLPQGLSRPTQLSSGLDHACVLDQGGGRGEVRCWGKNDRTQTELPRAPKNPRVITASFYSSCTLDDLGLLCWGYDQKRMKLEFKGVRAFVLGLDDACVLDDGGLRCVETGAASRLAGSLPKDLRDPQAIAVSSDHACVLEGGAGRDSRLRCWRYRGGEHRVPALSRPRAVATHFEDTCALDDEGLKCWRSDGTLFEPVRPHAPREVALYGRNGCVLGMSPEESDGQSDERSAVIQCWGESEAIQTGIPTGLKGARSLVVGENHACVLANDGIHCWGNVAPPLWTPPRTSNPRSLVSGVDHACVLDDEGVKCWGSYLGATLVPRDFDDWSAP
jgi:alpha-tubulin suppressor-like RCC1 family protein